MNISSISFNRNLIAKNGAYTLLMFVPCQKKIKIGRMGIQVFPGGYYAYTGSALGGGSTSLEQRISRHLRKNKKMRWHIDFFSGDEDVRIISALIAQTDRSMECEINQHLREKSRSAIPIPRFGSSDCRRRCGSHLLYLGCDVKILEEVTGLFEEKMGKRCAILRFNR